MHWVPGEIFDSRKKWYLEFCDFTNTVPYPTSEFKITKFATFLSKSMKTVESIKMYCGTVCQENELRRYRSVYRGIRYHKAIAGIRNNLHHQVKHAEPMTEKLLNRILYVVDLDNQKQLVVWVSLLTGYYLVLRKSNLVPLSRVHDTVHNITRQDVRYDDGLMIVFIRWTKNKSTLTEN